MIARTTHRIPRQSLGQMMQITRLARSISSAVLHPGTKMLETGENKIFQHAPLEVDWFPMKLSDLDQVGNTLMGVGQGPNKEHPSYTDAKYRSRREELGNLGVGHKMGGPIPKANYTEGENRLWQHIYSQIRPLHDQVYCREFLEAIRDLERKKLFRPDKVPELADLDSWLREVSDWRVKPVGGILTQREFLNCLAFRTFCSAQYLRHPAKPDYTPEPDIMHEFVGHIPNFANPQVCELSQRLGELSLGATDRQIEEIGAIYWYTIEFGLCREGDDIKVYGAGPAGSVAEMRKIRERVAHNRQSIRKLDICRSKMPTDIEDEDLQSIFYAADSYKDFLDQINNYTKSFERKFQLSLNRKNLSYACDRDLRMILPE